jgi:hypothetical protein
LKKPAPLSEGPLPGIVAQIAVTSAIGPAMRLVPVSIAAIEPAESIDTFFPFTETPKEQGW